MKARQWRLVNAEAVDAVPAHTVRARALTVGRQMADAHYLIRRKRDGRFLALLRRQADGYHLQPLHPDVVDRRLRIDELLRMLGVACRRPLHSRRPVPLRHLPRWDVALPPDPNYLHSLLGGLAALQIDPLAYAERSGLPLQLEPPSLRWGGRDRYGRGLWLLAGCARAWTLMRQAAAADGIQLEVISGFRSHAYQLGIIERKRRRGLDIESILAVNAAPGFSEHHSGRALDISCPGEPAAEESFENSAAFAWLQRRASEFGFALSYPRDNPHGIVYEPWHWCWHG